MSRSYKKIPICQDKTGNHRQSNKEAKAKANRRFRRKMKSDLDFTLDNSDYKKFTESYDISDYTFYVSLQDARAQYEHECDPNTYCWIDDPKRREECAREFKKEYPTFEEYRDKWWAKYYKRK